MQTSAVFESADLVLAALVSSMVAGSEGALAELFDRCFDRVYGIVFRVLRNGADAEEVAMEVFHQAWRSAHTYDAARGTVTAWLAAIAWSRATDRRRRVRGAADGMGLHPSTADASYQDHEDLAQCRWFEAFEANRTLSTAVRALSSAQRLVLGLAYFEGLSHSEIAKETGLPIGTVKSHARRGIEVLRGAVTAESTLDGVRFSGSHQTQGSAASAANDLDQS